MAVISDKEAVDIVVSQWNTIEQKENSKKNKCDVCQKLFSNQSNLRKHMKNTHSENFKGIHLYDLIFAIICNLCRGCLLEKKSERL